MRSINAAFFLLFLVHRISAYSPPNFAPFLLPSDNEPVLLSNDSLSPLEHELFKRASCPKNYNSCSTFAANAAGSCCTAGSICTVDNENHIACCREGATCTGTIAQPAPTTNLGVVSTTTSGFVFGGGGGAGTTTTTSSSSSTSSSPRPTATGTASFVQNSYFPWPIIPTTYANSAACNSAYDICQSNYLACTEDLVGAGFAVTISVPGGGGTTVGPTAAGMPTPSATSICSSLYSQGCFNIQSTDCAQFGTATNTGFFISGTGTSSSGAAPRPDMGSVTLSIIAAALFGVMGQLLI